MNRNTIRWLAVALALGLTGGCGDGEGDANAGGDSEPGADAAARAQSTVQESLSRDQPVDAELAARGETLFQNKGCVACHSIGGGRLVGPDLQGVTERRELGWVQHMILNPDSMLQNDATARELLAEYFTPMTTMTVSPEEARALVHFLRRETEAASGGS